MIHQSAPRTRREYGDAMRRTCSPTQLAEVTRWIVEVASRPDEPREARMAAATFLVDHLKGRPLPSRRYAEPCELPTVHDATSALEAYNQLLRAMDEGSVCLESATHYARIIGEAAKIALADGAVQALAAGGSVEFAVDADAPVEVQVEALEAFLAQRARIRE